MTHARVGSCTEVARRTQALSDSVPAEGLLPQQFKRAQSIGDLFLDALVHEAARRGQHPANTDRPSRADLQDRCAPFTCGVYPGRSESLWRQNHLRC
jgi:hypothetical protein